MRVRTAAAASSREGRGTVGSGAARTCSDSPVFGNDLMMASITVSPFDRDLIPEVSPVAASHCGLPRAEAGGRRSEVWLRAGRSAREAGGGSASISQCRMGTYIFGQGVRGNAIPFKFRI